MRRTARKLLLALLVTPFALLAVAVVWLSSLDVERYREDIGRWSSEFTGRPVTIAGSMELDLFPHPGLRVRDLRVGNAAWGSGGPMLVVHELDLRVAPLALLQGRLSVPQLSVHGAELLLERQADGAVNWRPVTAAPDAGAGVKVPTLVFEQVRVEDLRVRYLDAASDQALELRLHEINLASPEADGELTAQGRGELSGAPLEVALRLASLAALLAGRETQVEARLALAGVTLRLEGGLPARDDTLTLQVDLQAPSLGDLVDVGARLAPGAAALHELAPAIMPLAPVALSSSVVMTGLASLRLEELRLQAGDERLNGELHVQTAPRLRVDGSLQTPRLRLADLFGDARRGESRVFSSAPLPWSAMDELDLRLDLRAGELLLGGLTLHAVELPVRLVAGEAVVTPAVTLAGGGLRGELQADAATHTVHLRLAGEGMDLGRLQRELGLGDDVSDVVASLDLDLRGAGDSLAQVAGSLDGGVLVRAGAGRVKSAAFSIAGADLLLEFLRAVGVGAGGEMKLECGVARLEVTDGIARAGDGVGLRFNRANVIGGGSIDLGRETLDLTLALEPREGIGLSAGTALANMVAVRGTLVEPYVTLSAEGMASTGARVGAAVVTGGLSLLVGALVDRVTADKDPCATALGTTPAGVAGDSAPTPQPAGGGKNKD